MINNHWDLFKLRADHLEKLAVKYKLPWKNKTIKNIMYNIEIKRNISVDKLIMLLNIPGIGTVNAQNIGKNIHDMKDLYEINTIMQKSFGIGLKKMSHIDDRILKSEIDYVKILNDEKIIEIDFKKRNFPVYVTLSGRFSITKNKISDLLKHHNIGTNNINKNTSLLFLGKKYDEKKLTDALKYEIPIIHHTDDVYEDIERIKNKLK